MVRLTNTTKLNRNGETVDASLFLVHFDSRNLAIIEGEVTYDTQGRKKQNVIGYYGDVKNAFIKSIDIAIKHEDESRELSEVLKRINDLTEHIETVCEAQNLPTMMQLLKGGEL